MVERIEGRQSVVEKKRVQMREIRAAAERHEQRSAEEKAGDDASAFTKIRMYISRYSPTNRSEHAHYLMGAMQQVLADWGVGRTACAEYRRLQQEVEKIERESAAL